MTPPAFLLVSDLSPREPEWPRAQAHAEALAEQVGHVLGFQPRVRMAALAMHPAEDAGDQGLSQVLSEEAGRGAAEIFVLPASLDWNLWQRETLGTTLAEFRRLHGDIAIAHDDADPCNPMLVECFAEGILRALQGRQVPPRHAGLLLVANGHGDAGSRAQSYRLMRLLWEQLSLGGGDVAYLRHKQVFLGTALERCAREPLNWILAPQSQWRTEHLDYARTILEDFRRVRPEAAGWPLIDPPGDHRFLTAWYAQRMIGLWRNRRERDAGRTPSRKSATGDCAPRFWTGAAWEQLDAGNSRPPRTGFIARAGNRDALAAVLREVLPESDTFLVKVTWHGYATGTYTDPAALDLLLGALPGRAILMEGHTSSRNLGGANWDWEHEARKHRAWIRQQDAEYLKRTGLADVIAQHRAQYLNVTEAYWDGACATAGEITAILAEAGVSLRYPELTGFVPAALLALRGAPFVSFARFKGPTRLGVSNLFGLIPTPLRSAWHGPNITCFSSVCCDLAKLYGTLFPMFGAVEALHSAVRWDRKGLYRSRWGNYDIVLSDGVITLSEGLAGADILASRLQGQDVSRSAFFSLVKEELGWPEPAATQTLPLELQTRFS